MWTVGQRMVEEQDEKELMSLRPCIRCRVMSIIFNCGKIHII